MIRLVLLALTATLFINSAKSQVIRCGTDEHQAELEAKNPQVKSDRAIAQDAISRFIANNPSYRNAGTITIPVVFHIIYNNATQNIANLRIFEQMNTLRADFARTNADAVNTRPAFVPVATATQIDFCLAQQTPTGAATNGIIRVPTSSSTLQGNPSAISPEWDHTRYLNIYVGNLAGGVLGYTNLPPGSPGDDHVVILYSTVGGPNLPGSYTPYHLGRTVTHEVGHWLNLQHTFEGGCAGLTSGNCATAGDYICDTPPVSIPSSICPANTKNTCTELSPFPPPYAADKVDMYENYMDYTDDICMNMFTIDQASRMNAALTLFRSQLFTSNGCIPVGLNELPDPSYVIPGPNPSNGIFHVQFNFPTPITVNLEILDLAGRTIYRSTFETTISSNSTIDLSDKAEGVYLLKATTQNGYVMKKIVVAR